MLVRIDIGGIGEGNGVFGGPQLGHLEDGQVYEVPDDFGKELIAGERAVPATPDDLAKQRASAGKNK
jgi:hypothetical protein